MLAELTPCLQLVAPVGMDEESQDTWFEAALKALSGMPIGLLRRGAMVAMRKADHPSKIVPAIMAEVSEDWDWRRKRAPASSPALPAPREGSKQMCSASEAETLCRQFGVGRFSPHASANRDPVTEPGSVDPTRHCKMPTRADYIRMGVDPSVLDKIEQEKSEQQRAA